MKAIIFDWGRTLYDSEQQALFPATKKVLQTLAPRYKLAIASLASDGNIAKRHCILTETGIASYFASIHFAQADKDRLYEQILLEMGLPAQEVAIVDDRVVRGIRWGNQHGATTIWLKCGKFATEEPDEHTGKPTHSITEIDALCRLPFAL